MKHTILISAMVILLATSCGGPVTSPPQDDKPRATVAPYTTYDEMQISNHVFRMHDKAAGVVCWIYVPSDSHYNKFVCIPTSQLPIGSNVP